MTDLNTLLEVASDLSSSTHKSSGCGNRGQQYCDHICKLYTEECVAYLSNRNNDEDARARFLAKTVHSVGVSCPSEQLKATIGGSLVIAGLGDVPSMSSDQWKSLRKLVTTYIKDLDKTDRYPFEHQTRIGSDPSAWSVAAFGHA